MKTFEYVVCVTSLYFVLQMYFVCVNKWHQCGFLHQNVLSVGCTTICIQKIVTLLLYINEYKYLEREKGVIMSIYKKLDYADQ